MHSHSIHRCHSMPELPRVVRFKTGTALMNIDDHFRGKSWLPIAIAYDSHVSQLRSDVLQGTAIIRNSCQGNPSICSKTCIESSVRNHITCGRLQKGAGSNVLQKKTSQFKTIPTGRKATSNMLLSVEYLPARHEASSEWLSIKADFTFALMLFMWYMIPCIEFLQVLWIVLCS